MGFFTGLDTEGYDRQYSDRQLLGRIARYFEPFRRQVTQITIALVVVSLAGAAAPIIVSRAVDVVGEALDLTAIYLITAAILVTGLISWAPTGFAAESLRAPRAIW